MTDFERWNSMSEEEQIAFAMSALKSVIKADKKPAQKRKKMQDAAKDFCNINTIDKVDFNTIVTYNM